MKRSNEYITLVEGARPSDYDYIFLAQQAYQVDGGLSRLPAGVKIIAQWLDRNNDGYHGFAYHYEHKDEIIIAHRGTNPQNKKELFKDVQADIEGIIRCQITSQQISALAFSLEIKENSCYSHCHISFAGHSLGGWLAQIIVYHFKAIDYYTHAVIADSPGAADMIEKLQSNLISSRIKITKLPVVNYVSAPNLINCCGKHIGHLYRLYPVLPPFKNKFDEYIKYTATTHNLTQIVATFNQTTGLPNQYHTVKDWPLINWPEEKLKEIPVGELVLGASPYRLPKIAEEILAKVGNKIANKIFEAIPHYKELNSLVAVLIDLGSGKVNLEQYRGFHRYADQDNGYQPQSIGLSFEDAYFLNNKFHYNVTPSSVNQLPIYFFSSSARKFLRDWQKHRDALRVHLSQYGLCEQLQSALLNYRLSQDKKTIELAGNHPNVFHLREAVHQILLDDKNKKYTYSITEELVKITSQKSAIPHEIYKLGTEIAELKNIATQNLQPKNLFENDLQQLCEVVKSKLREYLKQIKKTQSLVGRPMSLQDCLINISMIKPLDTPIKTPEINTQTHRPKLNPNDIISGTRTPVEVTGLLDIPNAATSNQARIVILGEVGMGKKTLLQYLAYRWSNGYLWNDRFAWLFMISLNNLTESNYPIQTNKSYTASDIIYRECFRRLNVSEQEFQRVWSLIKQDTSQMLLLIQDHDKFKLTTSLQHLQSAIDGLYGFNFWIVTSRVRQAENLVVDARYELTGLKKHQIEQQISLQIDNLQQAQQLNQYLKSQTTVMQLATIPSYLAMICAWWTQVIPNQASGVLNTPTLTTLNQELLIISLRRFLKNQNNDFQNSAEQIEAQCQILLQFLSHLAFLTYCQKRLLITRTDIELAGKNINQENQCRNLLQAATELGMITVVQASNIDIYCSYRFVHETALEFLTAKYIASVLLNQNSKSQKYKEILQFIQQHKNQQLDYNLLGFVAGLLTNKSNSFKKYIDLLFCKPREIVGYYEVSLLIHCLKEGMADLSLPEFRHYRNHITSWIAFLLKNNFDKSGILINSIKNSTNIANELEIPFLKENLQRWVSERNVYAIDLAKEFHNKCPLLVKEYISLLEKENDINMQALLIECLGVIANRGNQEAISYFTKPHKRTLINSPQIYYPAKPINHTHLPSQTTPEIKNNSTIFLSSAQLDEFPSLLADDSDKLMRDLDENNRSQNKRVDWDILFENSSLLKAKCWLPPSEITSEISYQKIREQLIQGGIGDICKLFYSTKFILHKYLDYSMSEFLEGYDISNPPKLLYLIYIVLADIGIYTIEHLAAIIFVFAIVNMTNLYALDKVNPNRNSIFSKYFYGLSEHKNLTEYFAMLLQGKFHDLNRIVLRSKKISPCSFEDIPEGYNAAYIRMYDTDKVYYLNKEKNQNIHVVFDQKTLQDLDTYLKSGKDSYCQGLYDFDNYHVDFELILSRFSSYSPHYTSLRVFFMFHFLLESIKGIKPLTTYDYPSCNDYLRRYFNGISKNVNMFIEILKKMADYDSALKTFLDSIEKSTTSSEVFDEKRHLINNLVALRLGKNPNINKFSLKTYLHDAEVTHEVCQIIALRDIKLAVALLQKLDSFNFSENDVQFLLAYLNEPKILEILMKLSKGKNVALAQGFIRLLHGSAHHNALKGLQELDTTDDSISKLICDTLRKRESLEVKNVLINTLAKASLNAYAIKTYLDILALQEMEIQIKIFYHLSNANLYISTIFPLILDLFRLYASSGKFNESKGIVLKRAIINYLSRFTNPKQSEYDASDIITQHIKDKDDDIRTTCITTIMRQENISDTYLELLYNPNVISPSMETKFLAQIPCLNLANRKRLADRMLAVFNTMNLDTKMLTIKILAKLKMNNPPVINIVLNVLTLPDIKIKKLALDALDQLLFEISDETLTLLIRYLSDPDKLVRSHVAKIILKLKVTDPSVIQNINKSLLETGSTTEGITHLAEELPLIAAINYYLHNLSQYNLAQVISKRIINMGAVIYFDDESKQLRVLVENIEESIPLTNNQYLFLRKDIENGLQALGCKVVINKARDESLVSGAAWSAFKKIPPVEVVRRNHSTKMDSQKKSDEKPRAKFFSFKKH